MKHRVASIVVTPFLLAAVAGSAVADPPEACVSFPAVVCGSMPYLTGEDTWFPEDYNWEPNRLPAAWINLWSSEYCSAKEELANYRGSQSWWYDQDDDPGFDGDGTEVFDDLTQKLNDAYLAGYRRIILNLPAGSVFDQDVSSSQWWAMPEWKRAGLTCVIENWLSENPTTQFEIYGAFPVNDPTSLCMQSNPYEVPTIVADTCIDTGHPHAGYMYYPCHGATTSHPPSAFVQADVCLVHRNIQPWQYLGITRYWLDFAYEHTEEFLEFPYCPLYAPGEDEPHFLGAEAFPFTEGEPTDINMDLAIHCPAIIFPNHIAGEDPDWSWDVSADYSETELVVIFDYTMEYFDVDLDNDVDMFDVLDWTQRGFVLAAQSSQAALVPAQFTEYMKRVYDFGTLINRRDFNGDGVINSSDLNDFDDQYALYSGQSNCNWVHGDVNGDHQVTLSDATAYHWWYAFQGGVDPPNVANLGNANPDNALTRPD